MLPDAAPTARDTAARRLDTLAGVYAFLCGHTSTAVGILLFVVAWMGKSHDLVARVGAYDEGILLSGANALLIGDALYRDFYTSYPPGIFLALAALWKVFGVSLAVYRIFAVAIHLALAILAGRLATRVAGVPGRFSWLACAVVTAWTVELYLIPFAWLAGLAFMLFTVDRILWAIDQPSRRRFVIVGIVYGLVSCFRHDLFVYFTGITAVLLLVPARVWAKFMAVKPSGKQIGHVLMGAAIPIVLVWGPTVAIAGLPLIVRDIFLDQVRYVMPGRVLPMPPLFSIAERATWPPFVTELLPQAVVITLVAPLLAFLHCLARRPESAAAAFLAPVTAAVIPQMMARTDMLHAVDSVVPGLIVATAFVERIRFHSRFSFARATLPLLFVAAATSVVREDYWPPRGFCSRALRPDSALAIEWRGGFQFDPTGRGEDQRAVVEFIRSHTDRKERIFIGLTQHEQLVLNEASLYFLADRLAGVRWAQFEPNLVTGRPVQEEMIASMERYHVRVVVLSARFDDAHESRPPVVPPSPLLDNYIREHFTEAEHHGVYTILTRDL
jgi:hypothetical protein